MWDPAAVSRTQRRLHLSSEAGRRYERTVDPAISVAALDRCAALLAEIAGGTVEPTLTDWRGDPPRDDWSPPPVSMAVDLPDRTAGVDYAEGTAERRLDPDRCRRRRRRRAVDRDAAELAARPAAARRPRRRGAAAGGSRDHPVGAAAGTGGPRPDRRCRSAAARSGSRWRSTVTSRFCRRRSCPRACSTSGACPPTIRGDRRRRCSTRWRPTARSWPPRCCRVCWKRWAATCPAALSTWHCSRSSRWSSRRRRRRAVERIPIDRRPTDDEIATLDASLPRQPQHVGVGAGRTARAVRSVGTGPAGATPPTRSRRCASIARAAGVELTLRPAQHLPWHPGRCAEVVLRRRDVVVGHAGRLHPAVVERTGLPKGTCAVELDLDADSASPRRCPRPRCRRFPRCSRTSASSSTRTSPRRA